MMTSEFTSELKPLVEKYGDKPISVMCHGPVDASYSGENKISHIMYCDHCDSFHIEVNKYDETL